MGRLTTKASRRDPTIYPEEERVGEEMLQRWIVELLRPLLERWLNQREVAFVGADQFVYYKQYDATQRYAPDVYVIPGVAPATRVRSWKVWERGLAPSFALEVASRDWEKDYAETPERCRECGIGEVVVFDPGFATRPGGRGFRWQVFRGATRHGLRRIEATNDDRVRSRALGCWLVAVGSGDAVRVRLGVGPRGGQLVPTEAEQERAAKEAERAAKEAERAAKEAERAAKEQERAAKEAERAAKEAALAQVEQLKAELARLRRRRARPKSR